MKHDFILQLKVHFLTVDPEYTGQRLDNFLRSRYKALPKSRLYRIIRKGEVRVNKKRIDPDYRLNAGDTIRMPPLHDEKLQSNKENGQVNTSLKKILMAAILYENKKIIILNKPSGLAVHGGSGIRMGIIEAMRILRPHDKYIELVHRLDRETSGCLLIAKKPSILKELHALLRDQTVSSHAKQEYMSKNYICLVKGRWPKKLLTVNHPLEGKASKTNFKLLKSFHQSSLIQASLETGRNHQIRLHALHVGHPVVGDEKYGDKEFNKFMKAYGCDRLFLHAESLSFILQDEKISVHAPLDKKLMKCLERLEGLNKSK